MSAGVGGWRLIVGIFVPIPLVLAVLLAIPFPRNVRKGILLFTHKILSFPMIGGLKFVHFSLGVSGIPLLDSIFRTVRTAQAAHADDVRPEIKISLLAKKWREERNFWIAALGFILWCLLSVLFAQVSRMVKLEDDLEQLKDEVADLKGEPRPSAKKAGKSKMAGAIESLKRRGGKASAEATATKDE